MARIANMDALINGDSLESIYGYGKISSALEIGSMSGC
jgi:hypothetical protein